jgi:hypothetical protein
MIEDPIAEWSTRSVHGKMDILAYVMHILDLLVDFDSWLGRAFARPSHESFRDHSLGRASPMGAQ